jgi:putative aminopeptidase FrvX
MNPIHEQWLLELTRLPTAAGREQRVIAWVRHWAKSRRNVELKADRFGNLLLQRRGTKSTRPIFFTAHLDHPAFVVTEKLDSRRISTVFRGGVSDSYFVGTGVLLHRADSGGGDAKPQAGKIVAMEVPPEKGEWSTFDGSKRLTAEFSQDVVAEPGDVMTWDVGPQRVEEDRLFTPACDDLAGVAAALSAFDELRSRKRPKSDVRVLLTRAEEVGFVGAIAACKARSIPKGAKVIALENSKSYAESPIGGGPIVRVGDLTSTFDPDLTYRIGKIAQELAGHDAAFKWQRKLMPGGTCEASAYQSYGYTATCLCLPLGNYHNMNEATGKIEAETIALSDYHGLIRLLVAVGENLDNPAKAPPLRTRLEALFASRKGLL